MQTYDGQQMCINRCLWTMYNCLNTKFIWIFLKKGMMVEDYITSVDAYFVKHC